MTKVNSNFAELAGDLQMSGNTLLSADTNGNIILDPNGTGQVQIEADRLVIKTTKTATAVGNTGDVAGSISWDATNLYVCTANYDGSTVIWNSSGTLTSFGRITNMAQEVINIGSLADDGTGDTIRGAGIKINAQFY